MWFLKKIGKFFFCKKRHYAKDIEFINELNDDNFHLNPIDSISFHECRGNGVLIISFDFKGYNFWQQRLLPLDWNE